MLRFDDIIKSTSKTTTTQNMKSSNDGGASNNEKEDELIKASLLDDDDDNDNDGEEIEEDISDLVSIDSDGNVSMIDSDGNSNVLGSINSDEEEDEETGDDDDDDNIYAGMSPEERLNALADLLKEDISNDTQEQHSVTDVETLNPASLQMGDEVDVYIRAVSTQSGRFMVTLDPSIKGRKLKDVKREGEVNKRMSRLISKMGGESGLALITNSIGEEMHGVIKTKSKSGDWYYVQPDVENGMSLPVGVGTSSVSEVLAPGERVVLRNDGIDETRGQLSFTILKSL